jgi:hypothetical protein
MRCCREVDPMTLTAARQVADAVLYEGYLLYPYRASAAKNQVRWQFGVLGPAGAVEAGVGEPTSMSTEVLVEARAGAEVQLRLRFLQVQSRTVERWTGAAWIAVDELSVAGARWVPFHEAVARELAVTVSLDVASDRQVSVPGGEDVEELYDGSTQVGRLVRSRWPLRARVTTSVRRGQSDRVAVLQLQVTNESDWSPGAVAGWSDRDVAARHSLVGTHLLLSAHDTDFVSLLDGPEWAAADAASCRQERCWPVLIADDDGRDAVLVSPIILGDHPSIAPESAGDLFDATEIDEILTLRVLTMTESEKAEARGTDPRAAALLARCEELPHQALERLHGAWRDDDVPTLSVPAVSEPAVSQPALSEPAPWWDARADDAVRPEQDHVLVAGIPVRQGSRVLLRPSRRADAQDLFLAGLTAIVARVYFDVDGRTHIAVALEDDPGADLYSTTGRFYYFAPDEIEPLPSHEDAR